MKNIKLAIGIVCSLSCCSVSYATTSSPFYVAANAGILQGSFSQKYLDQTDLIPQNIAESVQQHGYTAGLAVGYTQLFASQYLLGAELSGNLDSHSASYQSGAASTAFSDTTQINNHIDLIFVPGIMLSQSIAAYLKLGVSFASLQDNLTSPVGFDPLMVSFNSKQNSTGFVGALGIKKLLTDHVAVFVEGNYHDYGTVNFANFTNFSASYTHSAHVYSYGILIGASYNI